MTPFRNRLLAGPQAAPLDPAHALRGATARRPPGRPAAGAPVSARTGQPVRPFPHGGPTRSGSWQAWAARLATLLAAWLVGASAASAPAAAEPRTLNVGIGLPADSVQARAVRDFAVRVKDYSGGRLVVQLHAGGLLGNDLSMIQALQQGRLSMTVPDSSTLASMEKAFSVINYPFTFLTEAEADTVLDGPWGTRLLQSLPAHGLIGLAFWENGFRHMTNNRRPLQSSADFAGLRMRTMQNPMLVDSFRALGFDAVPMPFTQVFQALRNGVVDGQENPLTTIVSSRFHEVQSHLTLSGHVYSVHVLLLSRDVWDSLGDDDRAAIRRAATETRDLQRRWSRAGSAAALAELKARGMQVSLIPAAEGERIRRRLRDVFERHNRDIGVHTVLELYVALSRMRAQSDAGSGPADR
jgi:tripartite ATP-independent transporter DctP family solute receptor